MVTFRNDLRKEKEIEILAQKVVEHLNFSLKGLDLVKSKSIDIKDRFVYRIKEGYNIIIFTDSIHGEEQ